jgi:hypothetical protein
VHKPPSGSFFAGKGKEAKKTLKKGAGGILFPILQAFVYLQPTGMTVIFFPWIDKSIGDEGDGPAGRGYQPTCLAYSYSRMGRNNERPGLLARVFLASGIKSKAPPQTRINQSTVRPSFLPA